MDLLEGGDFEVVFAAAAVLLVVVAVESRDLFFLLAGSGSAACLAEVDNKPTEVPLGTLTGLVVAEGGLMGR